MTNWLWPALARLILADIVFKIVQKRLARLPGLAEKLVAQFAWAFVLSICGALAFGALGEQSYLVIVLGAVNSIGAYWHWRAIGINLAFTSVFALLDDLIAMTLAICFLGEANYFSVGISMGVAALMGGTGVLGYASYRGGASLPWGQFRALLLYVAGFGLVWGFANFMFRVFALREMSLGTFLPNWYLGALIGSAALLIYLRRPGATVESKDRTSWRQYLTTTSVLAVMIVGALALKFVTSTLAPVVVTQPFFQASELVCPLLVGLFLFRERKELKKIEWFGIGLATCGGLLVSIY